MRVIIFRHKSYHAPSLVWNLLSSVQFSHSVVPTLWPHGLQHARLPCASPTPRVYSNSCPSSRWCHPTISSSVVPFSFHLQSFPASGSFPMSQFFTSGDQSIGVSPSASVLPMNIQDWFHLGGMVDLLVVQGTLLMLINSNRIGTLKKKNRLCLESMSNKTLGKLAWYLAYQVPALQELRKSCRTWKLVNLLT